jgi:GxxExxY protein
MAHLRHEQLTYELRGLIFDMQNKLKVGWPEEIYHQGLVESLRDRGIPVESKPRRNVTHRGVEVHVFECDLIAWDRIVLELKVLPVGTFAAGHYAQLINYLKCWSKDLGLLVNFGSMPAQIERVVWDEPKLVIHEDYDAIKPAMAETDWLCVQRVRQNVLAVAAQYGLGYPETVYRRITAIEMQHSGLDCQSAVDIPAKLDGKILARHSSEHLLVEGKYLLNVRALLERPARYDFAQTKTFLNGLGSKFGLIVNFGKRQLQIYGVNAD